MGNGASATNDDLWAKVVAVRESNPKNLCTKHLDKDYFSSLDDDNRATFIKCVATGIENPDSGLGCYAMKPTDYATFGEFFNKVIGEYHKDDPAFDGKHETDWSTGDKKFDLQAIGLKEELSMRVRVGRNLTKFNLPGAMDKNERIAYEKDLLKSLAVVKEKFGGNIYSLTPDFGEGEENPNLISAEKYQELVDKHVMFKDMDADAYLKSAGISSDWPYGRGCWQSEDGSMIIWFGEEDHLRIMCMKKGFLLNEVFDGLKTLLDAVESVDGIDFATHEKFGYVTSCPSNLGTGMRASVHVKCPNLTKGGSDAKAKEIAGPLGLSVRGTGGEHTPVGDDGTIDISPRARLFIKECEILGSLMEGLEKLLAAESAAAE